MENFRELTVNYNKIDCCINNSFAVSSTGDLYVWGKTNCGLLSKFFTHSFTPHKV